MKMVTEPPRSNKNRSATPAAGTPRRAASGAQTQPGARKRNPAVKPAAPRQGKAVAQGQGVPRAARPNARAAQPGTLKPPAGTKRAPAAAPKQAVRAARPAATKGAKAARRPADAPGRFSMRGKVGLKQIGAFLRPAVLIGWIKTQVGTVKNPNWRGIATIALAILAVVALLYGAIVQSRNVSRAQQLEGFRARVITAVVVSHGFMGTQVDVNGQNVSVAQMDDPVPVGQPLRVRVNPNNPTYVVDARIEPDDAIANVKRNRLFTLLLALISGAAAAYLILTGRGKR